MEVLHADEFVPAVALGDVLQGLEFPGRHLGVAWVSGGFQGWMKLDNMMTYRAGTDVSDLSALNDIVESLHDLLARCAPIQAVDLQDVDVCAQTFDASIDGVKDVLAREAHTVDECSVVLCGGGDGRELALVIDAVEALGQNYHAVARDIVFLQGFSDNDLGSAVGVDIGLVIEN